MDMNISLEMSLLLLYLRLYDCRLGGRLCTFQYLGLQFVHLYCFFPEPVNIIRNIVVWSTFIRMALQVYIFCKNGKKYLESL